MNFLILSEEKHIKIMSFLSLRGSVDWTNESISLKQSINYDWIISYGYRHIIHKSIIDASKNKIINLHISYLPYNRGAHPNYWSFKDKTPKGVTIHFIDYGIDDGPILIQKKCHFTKLDTLKTSYIKLKNEIEKLFYDNFDKIIENKIIAKPQIGKGTINFKKNLPKQINWNINVNDI
ncbi:formyltransferase family protein [Flavobacteriaceae bacterium]|nr:formyltransferase family protein [Flavobacteriaceae bacterium]